MELEEPKVMRNLRKRYKSHRRVNSTIGRKAKNEANVHYAVHGKLGTINDCIAEYIAGRKVYLK